MIILTDSWYKNSKGAWLNISNFMMAEVQESIDIDFAWDVILHKPTGGVVVLESYQSQDEAQRRLDDIMLSIA